MLGTQVSFSVKVELDQGSALSPHIFYLVLDVITKEVRDALTRNIMFADDIVLCAKTRDVVEIKAEIGRECWKLEI